MRQTTNHTATALMSNLFALTVDAGYDWMCSRSRFWDQVATAAERAINAYGMQSPATADRFAALATTARKVAAMDGEGHGTELIAQLHRIAEIADELHRIA